MAEVNYARHPLILPFDDGEDSFIYKPCVTSKRLDAAERFRRQGKVIKWGFQRAGLWGKHEYPMRLQLDDAVAWNRAFWYRSWEPIDLSPYATMPSNRIPTEFWKWRIICEPAGLPGNIGFVQNPSAPPGQGASIMAEDLVSKEGALTNLPSPFSALFPNVAFTANLQLAYTDDGGTTLYWPNAIWN